MDLEQDRISNLPEHITVKILSLLPIRDALRTSILSSRWRYRWETIPVIEFDERSLISSQGFPINKLVNIVDHVLLLHTGLINMFKLSHRDLSGIADIDRWILYLSRSPIKKLILNIYKGRSYKLPSGLYSCRELVHLETYNCSVHLPQTFAGFWSLRILRLDRVEVSKHALESLISSCPLLKRLTLYNLFGLTCVDIHSPKLKQVHLGGFFADVNFTGTSILGAVHIDWMNKMDSESHGRLLKFFGSLPKLRALCMHNYFLKFLGSGSIPEQLPSPCLHLRHLTMHINLERRMERSTALCIFRSSPNLRQLEIKAHVKAAVFPSAEVEFWTEQPQRNCPLAKLEAVKLAGISMGALELDFIKFMLANSAVLERMTVKPRPAASSVQWEFAKELLRAPRASARAQIIFLDA